MRSLLERQGSTPLDDTVADRVLEVAAGNPLTLLELPLTLSPEQRVGREGAESCSTLARPRRRRSCTASFDSPRQRDTPCCSRRWMRTQRSRRSSEHAASSASMQLGSATPRRPDFSALWKHTSHFATRLFARPPCTARHLPTGAPHTQRWRERSPAPRWPTDVLGIWHEQQRRRMNSRPRPWPKRRAERATGGLTGRRRAPSSSPRDSRRIRKSGLAGSSAPPRQPISQVTSALPSTISTPRAPTSPVRSSRLKSSISAAGWQLAWAPRPPRATFSLQPPIAASRKTRGARRSCSPTLSSRACGADDRRTRSSWGVEPGGLPRARIEEFESGRV